jgi:hypothetical protein
MRHRRGEFLRWVVVMHDPTVDDIADGTDHSFVRAWVERQRDKRIRTERRLRRATDAVPCGVFLEYVFHPAAGADVTTVA